MEQFAGLFGQTNNPDGVMAIIVIKSANTHWIRNGETHRWWKAETQITLGFSGKGFQIWFVCRFSSTQDTCSLWNILVSGSTSFSSLPTTLPLRPQTLIVTTVRAFPQSTPSIARGSVSCSSMASIGAGAGQLSVIGCMKTDHRLSIQYITDASRFNGLPSHEAQLCRKNRVRYRKWVSYNVYSFLCRSLSLALEVVERRKTRLLLLLWALSHYFSLQ